MEIKDMIKSYQQDKEVQDSLRKKIVEMKTDVLFIATNIEIIEASSADITKDMKEEEKIKFDNEKKNFINSSNIQIDKLIKHITSVEKKLV